MAKAMSIAGMVIGGLVALMFGLDLALKIPFGRIWLPAPMLAFSCAARFSPISDGTRSEK